MRLLLVWPSAEMSTYDVAAGIRKGLRAAGVEVVDYRLYQRIKLMSLAFNQVAPEGQQASVQMACLHASEALPYRALVEGCSWALIISGMGLHPNAVWALRRAGVRVACWFTEAPYQSDEQGELHLARLCDLAFVNERTAVPRFQQALDEAGCGGRAIYLRHAYDPELHSPGDPEPEHVCDVLLVGTGFAERQMVLESCDWEGIDLRLGGIWSGVQEPNHLARHVRYPCLDNRDLVRLYRSARIVLNPYRWAPGAESPNPRTLEAAACGAFQIGDYRAEVAEMFGEAIPMYQPGVPWQLAALVRRYLADDEERRRLATLARERVAGETFEARARIIIGAMEEVYDGNDSWQGRNGVPAGLGGGGQPTRRGSLVELRH